MIYSESLVMFFSSGWIETLNSSIGSELSLMGIKRPIIINQISNHLHSHECVLVQI